MKEHNLKEHQSSKSRFLEKFTGKLNVITKHGEIKDQSSVKLPVINSPVSRRSNTVSLRPSKESAYSFFSHRRSNSTESSTIRKRAEKHLTQSYKNENIDISNKFMKKMESRNLKKICLKQNEMEPQSAHSSSKFRSSRKKVEGSDFDNFGNSFKLGSKHGNSDYHIFLKQLNHVSESIYANNRRALMKEDKQGLR